MKAAAKYEASFVFDDQQALLISRSIWRKAALASDLSRSIAKHMRDVGRNHLLQRIGDRAPVLSVPISEKTILAERERQPVNIDLDC